MRNEIEMADFGLWIKRKRKERGWNQRELARQIPCCVNQISRYELGELFPRMDEAEKLVSLLGAEFVIREKGDDRLWV